MEIANQEIIKNIRLKRDPINNKYSLEIEYGAACEGNCSLLKILEYVLLYESKLADRNDNFFKKFEEEYYNITAIISTNLLRLSQKITYDLAEDFLDKLSRKHGDLFVEDREHRQDVFRTFFNFLAIKYVLSKIAEYESPIKGITHEQKEKIYNEIKTKFTSALLQGIANDKAHIKKILYKERVRSPVFKPLSQLVSSAEALTNEEFEEYYNKMLELSGTDPSQINYTDINDTENINELEKEFYSSYLYYITGQYNNLINELIFAGNKSVKDLVLNDIFYKMIDISNEDAKRSFGLHLDLFKEGKDIGLDPMYLNKIKEGIRGKYLEKSESSTYRLIKQVAQFVLESLCAVLDKMIDLYKSVNRAEAGEGSENIIMAFENMLGDSYYDKEMIYSYRAILEEAHKRAEEALRQENVARKRRGDKQTFTNRKRLEINKIVKEKHEERYLIFYREFVKKYSDFLLGAKKIANYQEYKVLLALQFYIMAYHYLSGINSLSFLETPNFEKSNRVIDINYVLEQMIFSYSYMIKEYLRNTFLTIVWLIELDEKEYRSIEGIYKERVIEKILESPSILSDKDVMYNFLTYASYEAELYSVFMNFLAFSLFVNKIKYYISFLFPFELQKEFEIGKMFFSNLLSYFSYYPIGADETLGSKRALLSGFSYNIGDWKKDKYKDVITNSIITINSEMRKNVLEHNINNSYNFIYHSRLRYKKHTQSTPPFLYKEYDIRTFYFALTKIENILESYVNTITTEIFDYFLKQKSASSTLSHYQKAYYVADVLKFIGYVIMEIIYARYKQVVKQYKTSIDEKIKKETLGILKPFLDNYKDYFSFKKRIEEINFSFSVEKREIKKIIRYFKVNHSLFNIFEEYVNYIIDNHSLCFLGVSKGVFRSIANNYSLVLEDIKEEIISYIEKFDFNSKKNLVYSFWQNNFERISLDYAGELYELIEKRYKENGYTGHLPIIKIILATFSYIQEKFGDFDFRKYSYILSNVSEELIDKIKPIEDKFDGSIKSWDVFKDLFYAILYVSFDVYSEAVEDRISRADDYTNVRFSRRSVMIPEKIQNRKAKSFISFYLHNKDAALFGFINLIHKIKGTKEMKNYLTALRQKNFELYKSSIDELYSILNSKVGSLDNAVFLGANNAADITKYGNEVYQKIKDKAKNASEKLRLELKHKADLLNKEKNYYSKKSNRTKNR